MVKNGSYPIGMTEVMASATTLAHVDHPRARRDDPPRMAMGGMRRRSRGCRHRRPDCDVFVEAEPHTAVECNLGGQAYRRSACNDEQVAEGVKSRRACSTGPSLTSDADHRAVVAVVSPRSTAAGRSAHAQRVARAKRVSFTCRGRRVWSVAVGAPGHRVGRDRQGDSTSFDWSSPRTIVCHTRPSTSQRRDKPPQRYPGRGDPGRIPWRRVQRVTPSPMPVAATSKPNESNADRSRAHRGGF